MKLGLIGEKLPHSYSKRIFEEFLGHDSYDLIELDRGELARFVATANLDGFNVTVPYKTDIIPLLDRVDELAASIGAVNAVRREGNVLCGTNTDFIGLRTLILHSKIAINGKKVFILGTGGTSKTAAAVCAALGAAKIVKVSRRKSETAISYEEAPAAGAEVIINTTPVGMFPNTAQSPIDLRLFRGLCGVVDVVYNPLRTALIQQAKSLGIPAVSGLLMLAGQAIAAEAFFSGKPLTERELEERTVALERALRAKTENLVLVGMPAVGKTTVGRVLAQKLNCQFYDTDEELEKRIGSIPTFIQTKGEAAFRNEESRLIADLTKTARGTVIATGGGAVLSAENRRILAENGRIIFLERTPETPVLDGARPLSDSLEKWKSLWLQREPIYRSFADMTVSGFQTAETAVQTILKEL